MGTSIILRNDNGWIGNSVVVTDVVRSIEVIEGRHRHNSVCSDGVQPGEVDKGVALVFDIMKTRGLLIRSVRDLIVIASH